MKTETVKKILRPNRVKRKPPKLLNTGSTLLNLACSGRIDGGFPAGEYILFIGDTDSGKTWACLNCFAEAAISKHFSGHRFIYDGPEGGALMDIERYFGKKVFEKLEPPAIHKDGTRKDSETVEEFYYNVSDALAKDEPFIYVLDSVDSLTSKADAKKFRQQRRAYQKEEDAKGSYGTAKAKVHSEFVRTLPTKLKRTGSIVIIINQTRDNIGFTAMFGEKKTRSGGRALEFFACMRLWSSVKKKLKKQLKNGKKIQVGNLVRVQVKRSRLTGKDRIVEFPIYSEMGIDDVGSCVDYLCEWGFWKVDKGVIDAKEWKVQLRRDALIAKIEEEGLEKELQGFVGMQWQDTEDQCSMERKRRYA